MCVCVFVCVWRGRTPNSLFVYRAQFCFFVFSNAAGREELSSWLLEILPHFFFLLLLPSCSPPFILCFFLLFFRKSISHPRAPLIIPPHQDLSFNPSAARSDAPSSARPPADSLFPTAKMFFFGSLGKERVLINPGVALPRFFITAIFVGRSENGDHNHQH